MEKMASGTLVYVFSYSLLILIFLKYKDNIWQNLSCPRKPTVLVNILVMNKTFSDHHRFFHPDIHYLLLKPTHTEGRKPIENQFYLLACFGVPLREEI